MKRRITAQFEPETRFNLVPVEAAPFRETLEGETERLKNRLLLERLGEVNVPELNTLLRHAANEAEALAQTTAFPLLVLPALFEEKARALAGQLPHQPSRRGCLQPALANVV